MRNFAATGGQRLPSCSAQARPALLKPQCIMPRNVPMDRPHASSRSAKQTPPLVAPFQPWFRKHKPACDVSLFSWIIRCPRNRPVGRLSAFHMRVRKPQAAPRDAKPVLPLSAAVTRQGAQTAGAAENPPSGPFFYNGIRVARRKPGAVPAGSTKLRRGVPA